MDWAVIRPVHIDSAFVNPIRNLADRTPHVGFGARLNGSRYVREIFDPLVFCQMLQGAPRRLPRRYLSGDVTHHEVGNTNVGPQNANQLFVVLTFAHKQRERNSYAFLEYFAGISRPQRAADIGHVSDTSGPPEQTVVEKNRRDNCDVRKMPGD